MKNIMTTMITAMMNIAVVDMNTTATMSMITMDIVPVGMTMKKKIAVCVDTITMGTVMMNITTTVPAAMTTTNMTTADTIITGIVMMTITTTVPVDMTTTTITDTIIQVAAVNIITAPQKRW